MSGLWKDQIQTQDIKLCPKCSAHVWEFCGLTAHQNCVRVFSNDDVQEDDPMSKIPTVAELIEYLKELPPHAKVVFAKDPEGNGFNPWSGDHSHGYFVKAFDFEEFIDSDDPEGLEDHKNRKLMEAIVFWPE